MRPVILILYCWFSWSIVAQSNQTQDSLTGYEAFWRANKRGMISLTTWSSVNLVSSLSLNHVLSSEVKYFNQMNGAWNIINLGLAVPGLIKSNRMLTKPTYTSWEQDRLKLPKIYKVNFFLDFLYIGSGLTMTGLANKSKNPEMVRGFGQSILLQGSYLLVFDYVMYRILRKRSI